ncbi:MAG: hypothetical protein Q8K36_04335, partial [Alphaproteobacteria bacterium]|nr:hypothetical protein [Alphaproteobacteria bacterium]
QGFSSAGEAKGAEIFVAELVPKFPKIFIASIMVPITCDLGGLLATLLGALCLSLSPEEGWKVCFYIGSGIAFCSSVTRKKLKETKDFINHSRQKAKTVLKPSHRYFEKRNFLALIGLNMICPTAFYFAYSFGTDLLKDVAGLSENLILLSNSFLLIIEIIFLFICAKLAYFYNPFYILQVRTLTSFILMPLSFLWLYLSPSYASIFFTQLIVLLSTASFDPATPLIIKSFSIQTRFSKYSKAWALAKAIMYLSTGYLTYYVHNLFGLGGVLTLLMLFSIIFWISLNYFVPYHEMEDRYKDLKADTNEKGHNKKLKNTAIQEDTSYHEKALKKWLDS